MNIKQIKDKTAALIDKIGRKTVIIACAVIAVAGAVALNFILFTPNDDKETMKPGLDLSDLSSTSGAESGDNNTSLTEYFASLAMSRQTARDEAIEVLQAVIDNSNAIDALKTSALEDISKIAADIEAEANIESLLQSKGFAHCLAIMNGEKISVIVESDGLLQSEISQICTIVYEQAGIAPANLTIIEKSIDA